MAATAFQPRKSTDGTAVRPVHPHDVIDRSYLPDLAELRGKRIVTVDMDGTAYDAWACCGKRGEGFEGTAKCRHTRQDTFDAVAEVCKQTGAIPVVLSWRAGAVAATRRWLDHIADATGFRPAELFIPGAAGDVTGPFIHLFKRDKWDGSQVAFKVATVVTLGAVYGCEVVASFDDNVRVIEGLRKVGVPDARLVPRLVEVADHEWRAGYIGAPKRPEYSRSVWDTYQQPQATRRASVSRSALGIAASLLTNDQVRWTAPNGRDHEGRFSHVTDNGSIIVHKDGSAGGNALVTVDPRRCNAEYRIGSTWQPVAVTPAAPVRPVSQRSFDFGADPFLDDFDDLDVLDDEDGVEPQAGDTVRWTTESGMERVGYFDRFAGDEVVVTTLDGTEYRLDADDCDVAIDAHLTRWAPLLIL